MHASYGSRGCSPHGFVDSMLPMFGVGLSLLILSMNISPGSPVSHALSTISLKTSCAFIFPTTVSLLGLISSYSPSFLRASINASVTETEILKFVNSPSVLFMRIKSRISGWSMRRIPILAPRLAPPCFMTSVAVLYIFIKETGPLAMPPVEWTTSDLGLNLEKENPVPPPL